MESDRVALVGALVGALAACFHPTPLEPLSAPALGRATAEHGSPPPASWDFDAAAAISYALAHGPDAADRRDQEAVAAARIEAAKQLSNPQLHLGQTTEQDLLVGEQTRFVIAIRVFPDMPWAIDARVAQARASYNAERAVTTTAVRALTAQIEQLYAQLAFGDATREVIAKQRDVLTERRRVLAEQLAHNTATRLEVMLAEQDAADVEATLSAIDLAATRERSQLAQLIGIPAGQAWKPVLDLAAERKVLHGLDRGALGTRALARPELAELGARADAAEAAAYQQRLKRVPWVENVQVERSVRDNVEWAASASVSLPLFSFNSGAIAAADAQRRQYANERHRLAIDTVRQIDDAVARVEATARRVDALQELLAPATGELAALFAAEKTAAVSDPIKLLLLEERYVRAQRAQLDAAYDHRMAAIALEALIGGAP